MDSGEEGKFRFFEELVNSKKPVIPVLCHVHSRIDNTMESELALVYTDRETRKLQRLYGRSFAETLRECIYDVRFGKVAGVLVGMARAKFPNEQWSGHTIQRLDHSTNSIYRGILRIIQENDGIPVVVAGRDGLVADGIPAIAYLLGRKNPVRIQQEIKRHQKLQKAIEEMLLEGKPGPAAISEEIVSGAQGLSEKQEARIKNLKL
jgi:hypothetical protein